MQIEENRIQYLTLIQNTIDRMANTSSIFKGFAAAIVAGVTASSSEEKWYIILLGMLPIFCFAILDIYYLRIERKYRYLYNQVCKGEHEADFLMDIHISRRDYKLAKYRIIDCIISPSIFAFYGSIITIALLTVILKGFATI